MAFFAYTGLMGHGKSYGVVENVIIPAIQTGRHVITNLALNVDAIKVRWPLAKITLFESKEILEKDFLDSIPGGAVIVVDEAWLVWPVGLRWVNMSNAQQSFFTEHRHRVGADGFSQEICLLVPDLSLISKPVRDLVDTTYICTKLSKLGLTKRYRVDAFDKGQTGANPPKSKLVAQFYGTYKKEVYQYYFSHTKKDSGAQLGVAGLEKAPDTRANVFKSPAFIGGTIFVIVMLPLSIWGIAHTFGSAKGVSPSKKPADAVGVASAMAGQPTKTIKVMDENGKLVEREVLVNPKVAGATAQDMASLPLSTDWRYTGVIDTATQGRYVILTGAKGVRYFQASQCLELFREYQCVIAGHLVNSFSGEVQPGLRASLETAQGNGISNNTFSTDKILPSMGG